MGETQARMSEEELQRKLAEPFPPEDIDWRVTRSFTSQKNQKNYAFVVPYVQSRAIMNRLDSVVGSANWEDEYKPLHSGIICGLRIWLSNDKSRIKWDGADLTNYEATKGGLSNALKRAAVQWGIGRYLYNCSETLVEIFPDTKQGKIYFNDKKGIKGSWDPPELPSWALPQGTKSQQSNGASPQGNKASQPTNAKNQNGGTNNSNRGNNGQSRQQLVGLIQKFQQQIGLQNKYVIRIFNKANSDKPKIESVAYISQNASIQELQNYYSALKPVNDLCIATQNYNCSMEEMLKYVQIIKPEDEIKNLLSCFFILQPQDVQQIVNIAKQVFEQQSA